MIKPLALYFASLFAQPAPAPAAKVVKPPAAQVQIRVAAAPTAAEILSGVQTFYSGISGVNAKFRQEVLNTTFGRSDISDGYVRIQKPGKMRWEYYAKKQKGKATTVAKELHLERQVPLHRRPRQQAGHQEEPAEEPDADRDHLPLRQG